MKALRSIKQPGPDPQRPPPLDTRRPVLVLGTIVGWAVVSAAAG